MDFEKAWEQALKKTEIIRTRVQALKTSGDTRVPYIMLSDSTVNEGDTVVRKGEVLVEKPSLIIPPHNPQFNGFEFDQEEEINENSLINFLIVRGINLPSLRYDNRTSSLEVYEGDLEKAVKHFEKILQEKENVKTGLLIGPDDYWQFSVLIFICGQIVKNADQDIQKLLDEYKKDENK